MTLHVGQKVVCIEKFDRADLAAAYGVALPQKGTIYTVRNFEDRGTVPALRLQEIINPVIEHAGGIVTEPCFACDYIRPVVERKTSIEIFDQIRRDVEKRITELV